MGRNRADLVGQKYGKLTVLSFHSIMSKHRHWNCLCECGNISIVRTSDLKITKSCGCSTRQGGERYFWHQIYGKYKRDAKTRNIQFSLTNEEFKILCTQNCVYCNSEPKENISIYNHAKANRKKEISISDENYYKTFIVKNNGIDRRDNNIGYIISNCAPCCSICNFMKRTLEEKNFLEQIKRIYDYSLKDRQ